MACLRPANPIKTSPGLILTFAGFFYGRSLCYPGQSKPQFKNRGL